ncbi:hypothetical protein [Roseovarius sp. E0-M6]|uniref:hypothetical protein n=1 Tax=Roseovarius sp. E0-M6 TaxID=3127118 RepID=UPI0030102039
MVGQSWDMIFRFLLCAMMVVPAGSVQSADQCLSHSEAPEALISESLVRIDEILSGISPPTNTGIYQAYNLARAPLDLVYGAEGNQVAEAKVRLSLADYLRELPRIGTLQEMHGTVVKIDGFSVKNGSESRRRVPVAVVPGSGEAALSSGSAIQFGFLVSTALRSAADAGSSVDAEIRALYEFTMNDTLRFYWLEAPAWHWAGVYPNRKARSAARFGYFLRLRPAFFQAFTDYDLHIFALAANLRITLAEWPELARAGDLALIDEVLDTAFRAVEERMDGGESGDGFGFDRGRWRDANGFEYTACESAAPPQAPCGPPAADHPDVSHAQRWPQWLRSLSGAAELRGRIDLAKELEDRRVGLARQISGAALYWRDQRPVLRNFISGADGWYRYDKDVKGYGHPPSSLTGWAFGFGAYSALAPLNPDLAKAYREFCSVIQSDDPKDVAFRVKFYSQNPISPRPADAPAKDDYGTSSPAVFACRAYAALGCF